MVSLQVTASVKIIIMRRPEPSRSLLAPIRWWISIPFILALLTLVFWGWGVSKAFTYPYDGILSWTSSGEIRELDPNGPAYKYFEIGDKIEKVNGVQINKAFPLYAGWRPGDQVEVEVFRREKEVKWAFSPIRPPLDEIFSRLVPLVIALIFWAAGLSVRTFSPSDQAADMFFRFGQASALLLSAGAISGQGPAWTSGLFSFLLWLIGPITVHFHLHFPQTVKFKRRNTLLYGLYGLAFLGGSPFLILGPQAVRATIWDQLLLSSSMFFLALNLLLVIGLLAFSYRHAETAGTRGKIRIVVLGGLLSAVPLITLTILPDAVGLPPIVPFTYAFLLLGVLPITYGYAIFRHRLIQIEKHVNRGATFILVYSILGGVYLALYAFFFRLIPSSLIWEPLINTILVLVLASIFVPLKLWVQKLVDRIFYGGWYDYRTAVTQITQELEQITDLNPLAGKVSERLVKTLRLEDTCVFLRDVDGEFSVIEVAPHDIKDSPNPLSFSVLPKSSLSYLLNIGVAERSTLRQALSEVRISPEETQLLESEQVHLWVPIIGHGQVLGLLALGPKYGGDVFSSEDMDILRIVARQLGPLIENIHLVTRLTRYAAELEKRVEERTEELFTAKERVEAILASVGDGVVVTDLDWTVNAANTAFESQCGYLSQEITGYKIWNFINVNDSSGVLEEIKTSLQRGEIWNGELINFKNNGTPYDVQLSISPVRDQEGRTVGYVGSQRDITRYKQLDRLKDQLIFDVSHELRTPVTNLNLYLELMESGKPEKHADYLSVLKSETNRLIDLIESILDLSRLDMMKSKKVVLSSIDLNAVAEQVVAAHRPLADSAGLRLEFIPEIGLPNIRGEMNQLARLITNLLSNSIRYTPKGGISLRTYQEDLQACLEVQDTGMGIEAEDLPHLFDRFYRGRKVSQSKITGTGLGLAIVKEIVEIHEGNIEVESQVDQGTTFKVWLPIFEVEKWPVKPF